MREPVKERPVTECVKQRKKDGKYVSQHLAEPPEFDIK